MTNLKSAKEAIIPSLVNTYFLHETIAGVYETAKSNTKYVPFFVLRLFLAHSFKHLDVVQPPKTTVKSVRKPNILSAEAGGLGRLDPGLLEE